MPLCFGKLSFIVYRIEGLPTTTLDGLPVPPDTKYAVTITVAGTTRETKFTDPTVINEKLKFALDGVQTNMQVLIEVRREGDVQRNISSQGHPIHWFEDKSRVLWCFRTLFVVDLPEGVRVHLQCRWNLDLLQRNWMMSLFFF